MTDENKQAKNTQPDTDTSCELTDQEAADVAGGARVLVGDRTCKKCGTVFTGLAHCPSCGVLYPQQN